MPLYKNFVKYVNFSCSQPNVLHTYFSPLSKLLFLNSQFFLAQPIILELTFFSAQSIVLELTNCFPAQSIVLELTIFFPYNLMFLN